MPPPAYPVKLKACLFCDRVSALSSINQHLRTYDPGSISRPRKLAYHPTSIIVAYLNSLNKSPPLRGPKQIVLSIFALHVVQDIDNEAAKDQWTEHAYLNYDAAWWVEKIDKALAEYLSNGGDMDVLERYAEEVVAQFINGCIQGAMEQNKEDRQGEASERVVKSAKNQSSQNSRVKIADASGSNMVMQGASSKYGSFQRIDNASKHGSSNKKTHIPVIDLVGDDEEQNDSDLYLPERTSKRSQVPVKIKIEDVKDMGSSSKSTIAKEKGKATDAVAADAPIADYEDMEPIIILQVRGLDDIVNTIPIPWGTTLNEALDLAWKVGPVALRSMQLPKGFVSDGDQTWVGVWPEWCWEELMDAGFQKQLEVEVRMVIQ